MSDERQIPTEPGAWYGRWGSEAKDRVVPVYCTEVADKHDVRSLLLVGGLSIHWRRNSPVTDEGWTWNCPVPTLQEWQEARALMFAGHETNDGTPVEHPAYRRGDDHGFAVAEACFKTRIAKLEAELVAAQLSKLDRHAGDGFADVARIEEWFRSDPRPPACYAFTSGPERVVADLIEAAEGTVFVGVDPPTPSNEKRLAEENAILRDENGRMARTLDELTKLLLSHTDLTKGTVK